MPDQKHFYLCDRMQVSYLPSPGTASTAAPKECRAACSVCSPTVPSRDVGQEAAFMSSSRKSLTEGGWVQRQVFARCSTNFHGLTECCRLSEHLMARFYRIR